MTINDCLGYISLKQEEVKKLRARLESLEDKNLALKNQNTVLKYELHLTKARVAEQPKEEDNLRNRIKDLEDEIDKLKSNSYTISDSELRAIHTEDVETIDMLNIKVRDLNNTISTLLDRVSKSDKENQKLKKKVQDLNDFIQRI